MGLLLAVGVGGFFGAIARFVTVAWVTQFEITVGALSIPYGTLTVNVVGSFLLAVFTAMIQHHFQASENVRLFIATGFFGAFTTFSTFANEGLSMMLAGSWRSALLYIGMTNLLCILGAALGFFVIGRFMPTS
ncbi:MAG: fluoride efflux transporter CrcB [Anaerolineaceae bacterium]|nr:fluoride efflux transporter CrcB [Anaerolineaceae bacterium]